MLPPLSVPFLAPAGSLRPYSKHQLLSERSSTEAARRDVVQIEQRIVHYPRIQSNMALFPVRDSFARRESATIEYPAAVIPNINFGEQVQALGE